MAHIIQFKKPMRISEKPLVALTYDGFHFFRKINGGYTLDLSDGFQYNKTFGSLGALVARKSCKMIYDEAAVKSILIRFHKGESLALAIEHGYFSIAQSLIDDGFNPNHPMYHKKSALYYAVWHNHRALIKSLIKHDADLNYTDNEGDGLLHIATILGHRHSLQLLLTSGANPNITNKLGDTALDIAIRRRDDDICTVLLDALVSQSVTPAISNAILSIEYNMPGVLERLIKMPCDNLNLILAAQQAAACNNSECLRILLQDNHGLTHDNSGLKSTLDIAIKHGSYECVDLLMDYGATA